MQWNGRSSRLLHGMHGRFDGFITCVGFWCTGEVCGDLSKNQTGFRHTDHMDGLESGSGKAKSMRIRIPDILRCQDDESPSDEFRFFSPFQHDGQPVNSCVGIGSANGLDECADGIVMIIALFIIDQRFGLDGFR